MLSILRHSLTHGRKEVMAVFHDEVEIEDFEYDEESETYFYPCPCGDQFQIAKVGKTTFIVRNSKLDFEVLNSSSLIGAFIR